MSTKKPLSKMTKTELKEEAKALSGVELRKDDLKKDIYEKVKKAKEDGKVEEVEEKDVASEEAPEKEGEKSVSPTPKKPEPEPQPDASLNDSNNDLSNAEVKQAWNQDKRAIAKKLKNEPKVRTMVPKKESEPDGAYETVCINGYVLKIKKGIFVELPQTVANIIAESYNLTSAAKSEMRIGRSEKVEKALQ